MGMLSYICLPFYHKTFIFCHRLRPVVVKCSRRKENILRFHPDTSARRSVHYEPHINEYLDKKQREILKKFSISNDDCQQNPAIFSVHPQTIEHHGQVLQEGGFKEVTASLIVNYFKIVKKRIHLLKIHGYIEQQTSVIDSFLHYLGNPPIDPFQLQYWKEDENLYIDVYNEIVKIFLIWRLDSSFKEIERIIKIYPRIKHRSLKYLSWSLDILEQQLEFSKEKILRHGYLIHSYPYNTLDTLQRVPELCGKDIKIVLHRHPKIIMTNTTTILAIANHLKEYDIPDSAVQRRFDVFTLGSESMQRRLQQMRTVPELRPYAVNPRVLQIVHYQRKVSARLYQLQELQRQCASLHVLTSNQDYFDRFTREGMDRTRGIDAVVFLAKKLNTEELIVRNYLARHPFWCSVSLLTMQKTLDLLLERAFKEEVILRNIQLLLYPSEQVEKSLEGLATSYSLTEAQKLYKKTNGFSHVLTKKDELSLCLYFLEKDHHFTGNGIWNTQ